MRIILVSGAGPSRTASIPGAERWEANWRGENPKPRRIITADHLYREKYAHVIDANPDIRFTRVLDDERPWVKYARGDKRQMGFSGCNAIWLACQEADAVVITGFELTDADGHLSKLYRIQLPEFHGMMLLKECRGKIYRHPCMTGPLVDCVPLWKGQPVKNEWNGTWVLAAGGPSRDEAHDHWTAECRTGACNAGLDTIPVPDILWATDPDVLRTRDKQIAHALRHGSKLCDGSNYPYIERGPDYHGRSSGVMLARVAAMTPGTKRIIMCGYDGFTYQADYPKLHLEMNPAMARALANLMAEYPGIEFVWDTSLAAMARELMAT